MNPSRRFAAMAGTGTTVTALLLLWWFGVGQIPAAPSDDLEPLMPTTAPNECAHSVSDGGIRILDVDPADPDTAETEVPPVVTALGPDDHHRAPTEPAAAASLLQLHFDCGRIVAGQPIEHGFPLRNDSTTPLRILRAMPSMRCRMRFDRAVAPGTEGRFEVRLDTTALPPGPFRLEIRVQTASKVADGTVVIEGVIVAATAADDARR